MNNQHSTCDCDACRAKMPQYCTHPNLLSLYDFGIHIGYTLHKQGVSPITVKGRMIYASERAVEASERFQFSLVEFEDTKDYIMGLGQGKLMARSEEL